MRVALPGLLSWCEKDATVVFPSRLLASAAYRQFTAHQIQTGSDSWRRPALLTVGAWLSQVWQTARYSRKQAPALLSPAQEHLLWKQIIAREGVEAFDPDATASLAARAAALVVQYRIPADADAWHGSSDSAQFLHWLKLFRRACKAEGWLARFEMWNAVPGWLADQPPSQTPVLFAGLEPTPALDHVIATLGQQALSVPFAENDPATLRSARCFPDWEHELESVALSAREAFEANPAGGCAVLVPGLAEHRNLVDRTFRRICYPGAPRALLGHGQPQSGNSVYSLSAARPLSEEPVVAGALLLLELARPQIWAAEAGAIVRSPWIGGAVAERSARALAALALGRRRQLDVSLRDLEKDAGRCPLLVRRLSAAALRLRKHSPVQPFGAWTELIADLLAALGWPGDAALSSREQELVESWQSALSELSALSLVSDPVPWETALAELGLLLSSGSSFDEAAPIQILDPSAAPGLRFDRVILAGMSQERWPRAALPSPLVPLKLQREAGVPESSPATALRRNEQQLASFFQMAPHVTVAFSDRLSPLIVGFVPSLLDSPAELPPRVRRSLPPSILEELEDTMAPPYPTPDVARGGTGVIKSQSLCPFRAFAEYRLDARSLDEGCLGFDALEKGGHLHRALHFVWQNLGSLAELRARPPQKVRELVERAARDAVENAGEDAFGKIVAEIERARLTELISGWLELEKDRQHPFTVETLEEEQYCDLAGLRLRLRVDRIDRLPNGKLLLIDYKSGKQSYKALEGARPAEPQLLVYAASANRPVDGLFFAQLKAREQRFTGISRDRHFRGPANQISRDWDQFVFEAQSKVHELARQFREGYAAVHPAKNACEFCAEKPFCRIAELDTREEDEEC